MTESRLADRRMERRGAASSAARTAQDARATTGTSGRGSQRSRLVIGVFSLAAAALLLTGCGGGPASSTATTVRAKAAKSTPSPTTDPASTAVLAAYRAGWRAFEQALATANPADPALAATMVDPQLQGVKVNLLADQRQGMVGRGTFTLHPKIVAMSATTATVVDCAYSTAALVYVSTGKPVPPVTPPENDGVRATLVLAGGTWKISKQTVTDGKCAPGS
ncbi:MAG: hypothetical protein M0Z82_09315 [Actinomycetota bacterium]|nr:hypothetical protein [Actinomycetota bacterium]